MARRWRFASPEHSACPICGKGRGAQTPPGWDHGPCVEKIAAQEKMRNMDAVSFLDRLSVEDKRQGRSHSTQKRYKKGNLPPWMFS